MPCTMTGRVLPLLILPAALAAQTPDPWAVLGRARTHAPTPTTTAITPADLMSRLYRFADDSMQGRLLGSAGNAKGVEYIAAELKRLGLEPAGDQGSYFQTVPVVTRDLDSTSALRVNGGALKPWQDYLVRDQGPGARAIDGATTIYGGTWGDPATLIPANQTTGKVVVLSLVPAGFVQGIPGTADRAEVSSRFPGAAGIAIAGLDLMPPEILAFFRGAAPEVMGSTGHEPAPSFLYVTEHTAAALLGAPMADLTPGATGPVLHGSVRFVEHPLPHPARNVVAILRGSDPALRNSYVAIGAHNDHIGAGGEPVAHDSMYVVNHLFRPSGADDPDPELTTDQVAQVNGILAEVRSRTHGASARVDTIYNGADDDGSGSMGVLEMAEYFAGQHPRPKRSLLFVWHVGEEEGLYGSEWFTDHPTVPRDSIVAQLNMDMIGRGDSADVTGQTKSGGVIHGDSDYVQLIGSRRLSTELGDLAEAVNRSDRHGLRFDYALDADGHPQNIYCRSDHYEYARYGIPIIFFTTGGHADYHQVTDEPQYIDYDHYARVVRFVADLAEHVADLNHRPVVDKPRPDPHGACQQ